MRLSDSLRKVLLNNLAIVPSKVPVCGLPYHLAFWVYYQLTSHLYLRMGQTILLPCLYPWPQFVRNKSFLRHLNVHYHITLRFSGLCEAQRSNLFDCLCFLSASVIAIAISNLDGFVRSLEDID
jgi:hypothetical protein